MDCMISVIIPVYNCENYLKRAIESVIKQDKFNECELILVDDGSTDNSSAICDSFSNKYNNITVIHQHNSGVSVARNKGIEVSKGKWICFLDGDDYLLPGVFSLINIFRDTDLICFSHESNYPTISDELVPLIFGTYEINSIKDSLSDNLASKQYFYHCWAKLFKRTIITENNITFPIDRKLAEDMVFVYTYITSCTKITIVDNKGYYYYINPGNTTSVVKDSYLTLKFIYNWKVEYFKNIGWLTGRIENILIDSFVWNCFISFKSNATYYKFFDSIHTLNDVFRDDLFHELYLITDYKKFKTLTDRTLDWSIRNKNSIPFCVIMRINNLKTRILNLFLR